MTCVVALLTFFLKPNQTTVVSQLGSSPPNQSINRQRGKSNNKGIGNETVDSSTMQNQDEEKGESKPAHDITTATTGVTSSSYLFKQPVP